MTAETEKVLPCPFCGGEPKAWGEDSTWLSLCRVACQVCYANSGEYVQTRVAAIENWNRRALPVSPAPTVDNAAVPEITEEDVERYRLFAGAVVVTGDGGVESSASIRRILRAIEWVREQGEAK